MTLGISDDVLATSAGVTISATPFVLLFAYILRIGTVAKGTLSIAPFIFRKVDPTTNLNTTEGGL